MYKPHGDSLQHKKPSGCTVMMNASCKRRPQGGINQNEDPRTRDLHQSGWQSQPQIHDHVSPATMGTMITHVGVLNLDDANPVMMKDRYLVGREEGKCTVNTIRC